MSEKTLHETALLARRSIEPGLPVDCAGKVMSEGACLHACLVVVLLLKKFGGAVPIVRGGSYGDGARDSNGQWRGHYWVEAKTPDGAEFVIDITADQFGYAPVVVMPLDASKAFYRNGPQREVDQAFANIAVEFDCSDLVLE